jgi:nitrate reductase NapAB chaperone NapD
MNFEKDLSHSKDIQIEELKTELNRLREFIVQKENEGKLAVTISHLPEEERQRTISHTLEIDTDINIHNDIHTDKKNTDNDTDSTDSTKSNEIHSLNSKISAASSDLNDIVNGWDDDANSTLKNWYYAFEELSHSYQYILDRNYKISSNLSMISVISSSVLSIFSGFKLWIQDDKVFQYTSDIIMMVSNFAIAGVTTMAKRYIDDNRNEKIRIYIEEVDKFMNLVYAQYCNKPFLRMNAKDFFKNNNETYTRLMISCPNLSIREMELAKSHYKSYKKTFHC